MPQNPEKYFYINRVGLVRGSWALKKFSEDAELHHMEDIPAKLVALRLTEYYELMERLYAGQPLPQPGAIISSNGHAPATQTAPTTRSRTRRQAQDDEEPESPPPSEQLDPEAALDESDEFWGTL